MLVMAVGQPVPLLPSGRGHRGTTALPGVGLRPTGARLRRGHVACRAASRRPRDAEAQIAEDHVRQLGDVTRTDREQQVPAPRLVGNRVGGPSRSGTQRPRPSGIRRDTVSPVTPGKSSAASRAG